MDRLVEEAFRLNVKWSLQELSRAINGDGKTSPNPLFRVQVVLKDQITKPQVDFLPTSEALSGMVVDVAEGLTDCVAVIERLPDLLTRRRSTRDVRTLIGVTNGESIFFIVFVARLRRYPERRGDEEGAAEHTEWIEFEYDAPGFVPESLGQVRSREAIF